MLIDGLEYLELTEAAEKSGYDIKYLRRMAKAGKVPARQIGRSWVIRADFEEVYKAAKPQRKPRTEPGRRQQK